MDRRQENIETIRLLPENRPRLSQQAIYDTFQEHLYSQNDEKTQKLDEIPNVFLRKTVKFWVLPSNFLIVKKKISKHIPEWTFDGKVSTNVEDSGSYCNSIYFDTPECAMYDKRIMQLEQSMLFRYRWYGNKKCTLGFIEQKSRNPAWRGEASIKQRFELSPDSVYTWINQGPESANLGLGFIKKMHDDLLQWKPHVRHNIRSTYRRTVFQEFNGASIRVSFDEDITLTDVQHLTWEEALDPELEIEAHKIFHFPLGILEVKLAFSKFEQIDGLQIPEWIYPLQNAGLIIRVEKFSKYCTGAAVMNLDKIYRVPSWVAAVKTLMEVELARKGREWFEFDKNPVAVVEQNVPIPVRCEPREFMANERTLLKWVRMCFLALFVGLALLSFEYEPVTGVVLTICALLILARSYYVYHVRLRMLLDRNFVEPFYDVWGPPLIVALFVIPTLTYIAYLLGLWHVKK